VHFGETGLLVLSIEYQGTAFLLSVGNLLFYFFDGDVWALQLSGTVKSAGTLYTSGGKPSVATH
jgi:hypothetical protein